MDNINRIRKQAKGKVTYDSKIILSVINLATKEIAGVSSMAEKYSSVLQRWFASNYYDGVKLTILKDSMNVDVYVNVYFGYNVSEIAYRVQENIKSSISSMIEIKIDRVNVHVMGVDFPKEDFE